MSGKSRRDILRNGFVLGASITAGTFAAQCTGTPSVKDNRVMKAGFARVKITPPVGTAMTGFGNRDMDPDGCRGIHDDLYARALYVKQGNEEVLIMGFDLLFFSRDEADRYKGAISRATGLPPNNILLNTSHTHTGPKIGTWFFTPRDFLYLNQLELYIVEAAVKARDSMREVTLWAGTTTTDIPMSRRLPDKATGEMLFAPNPEGRTYNRLPICLIKDTAGKPVCLLFSVSCHPSTIKGDFRAYNFSADYPGAAMAQLDEYLGAPGSLFLQGVAGDTKASVIGKGYTDWQSGTWDNVAEAGSMASGPVRKAIEKGLTRIEPDLRNHVITMEWSLNPPLSRSEYEQIFRMKKTHEGREGPKIDLWAQEMMHIIDRNFTLTDTVPITSHAIQLGKGLRMVSLEGEAVAEFGHIIENFYSGGTTFPLGYTDGCQMYLPTTVMLDEVGYEVDSYWEYHQPTPLAGGHEKILEDTLKQFQLKGIG